MAKLSTREGYKLRQAASELRLLRQRMAVLEGRLSGFDDAMALLRADFPHRLEGASPDVAYELDQMAEEAASPPPEAKEPGPAPAGVSPPTRPPFPGRVRGMATGRPLDPDDVL